MCYTKNFISDRVEMTEEIKNKLSNIMKKKYDNGYIHPQKGTHLSNEQKENLSIKHTGKIISEKTKKLWSEQRSGEKNIMFGKKHTKKTKEKQSKIKKGNKNPMFGKKQKLKSIKIFSEKHKKPIKQLDLNGNLIKIWDSATDAAKELEFKNATGIRNTIYNKTKSAGGFKWEYV